MNFDVFSLILNSLSSRDIKNLGSASKSYNYITVKVLTKDQYFSNRLIGYNEDIYIALNNFSNVNNLSNQRLIYQSLLSRVMEVHNLKIRSRKNEKDESYDYFKNEYPAYLLSFFKINRRDRLITLSFFLQEYYKTYSYLYDPRNKVETNIVRCVFINNPEYLAEYICHSALIKIVDIAQWISEWSVNHLESLKRFIIKLESLKNYYYSCGIIVELVKHLIEVYLNLNEKKRFRGVNGILSYFLTR
jgi:hypothetical protein